MPVEVTVNLTAILQGLIALSLGLLIHDVRKIKHKVTVLWDRSQREWDGEDRRKREEET